VRASISPYHVEESPLRGHGMPVPSHPVSLLSGKGMHTFGAGAESRPLGSPPPACQRGGEGLGVGGALESDLPGPPPGSVQAKSDVSDLADDHRRNRQQPISGGTSPPSPPLVQVGCFRLGPIHKWPNPGTPGFGGGRVSALAVCESLSRKVHTLSPAAGRERKSRSGSAILLASPAREDPRRLGALPTR
jgi:hypothetical protein